MSESSTDDVKEGVAGGNVDTVSSSQDSGATSAESPSVKQEDAKQPVDMEAAVRAALSTGKEPSSSSGDNKDEGSEDPAEAADGEKSKAGEEGELGELTEEELGSYHTKTRRRVESLLRDKSTLTEEVKQLKPQAERMTNIDSFVQKNGLTPDDVNASFEIMRLVHVDPVRAYDMLKPIYSALATIAGDILPKDLKDRVENGQISEEDARELARLRSSTTFAQKRGEERVAQEEQERKSKDVKELADTAGKAVSNWENTWQASDPDYRHKVARVKDKITLEILRRRDAGQLPKNAQEAVDIAEKCKAEVEKEFVKLLPKKPAMKVPTGIGATNGSKPAPRNMIEAVQQALGR